MIISASRRTDIPAFYSQWFLNRLKEGFVLVRNPMNPQLVSKILLRPELIDCIVFWTKNPRNLMTKLDRLKDYHYYFLFTINSYGRDLERHLPPRDHVIDTFIELSRKIGKEKIVWRYDPILISAKIDEDFHFRNFDYIAGRLQSYTERCIISFIDMYRKCQRNLKGFSVRELNEEEMSRVARMLLPTAKRYGIEMVTCAEAVDFSGIGIRPGKCIDDERIARITGYELDVKKDKHQRKTCCCVESIDIGAYDTCPHSCLYCYANSSPENVKQNTALHNPESPLLLGELPTDGSIKIIERKIESFKIPYKNGGLFKIKKYARGH
jgi:hypothetical protein